MSKYFLVPDLHGELDMATGLLQQEGLLDDEFGRINYDTTLVQMGDFLNCVGESVVDDQRCLDHEDLFDVLLVGNHEHPYFGGPAFAGFHHDYVLMHRLKSLDSRRRYQVAVDCDGVLVTHAGVTTDLHKAMYAGCDVAPYEVADELNDLWRRDKTAHPFSSISWNRGGPYKQGGILWADWKEYKTPKFKQVVGHSVGEHVRLQYAGRQNNMDNSYDLERFTSGRWEAVCLDLGAGKHSTSIVGAWVEDGNVRLVEYKKDDDGKH